MKVKRILSFIIIITLILLIAVGWHFIFKLHKSIKSPMLDQKKRETKKVVPYFLIAVDISGSMDENDKENYEAEALKNIIRAIYFNTINQYDKRFLPRIQIVTFSGEINYITSYKKWETLNNIDDILALDKKIDKTLSDRNGDYTDFNELIKFILQADKSIKSENDIILSSIILTDGVLYPNFFNEINHKSKKDFKKFVNGFSQNESRFAYNLKYGINDSEKMNYAETEIQDQLRKQLELQTLIPIQLNIISLSKTGNKYLKKWTDNLGELHIIQKASDIGNAFLKIMSENLYIGYEKGSSLNGIITIKPFTNDILAAELITFNNNHLKGAMNKTGFLKLNRNLKKTNIFYFDENMKNFHNPNGYILKSDKKNKTDWLLITIHDNYLSFEKDKTNPFIYKVSLKRLKNNKNIRRSEFEIPLKVKINTQNNIGKMIVKPMDNKGYIKIDFSNCISGNYTVKFSIEQGQLKNDIAPLRKRSFVFSLIINQRFLFFDRDGNKLNEIIFAPVDRK